MRAQAEQFVVKELAAAAKANKLKGFERIAAVHLEPEAFSAENGLMTPSFKLKRPQLQKHYQNLIDECALPARLCVGIHSACSCRSSPRRTCLRSKQCVSHYLNVQVHAAFHRSSASMGDFQTAELERSSECTFMAVFSEQP